MKVCIIGATGHTGYVFEGLSGEDAPVLAGIAPGSPGESIDGLYRDSIDRGFSPERFDDYMEMLSKLKPDIAAVACYFSDHAKVAAQALKMGIHVFVEKPVATTLEDLEMLKEVHRDSGVHLCAMLGLRYEPSFRTAWKAVKDGKIGSVRLMSAQKSYKLGSRQDNFKKRETYGGTIPWVGSHAIDWLYWIGGEKFESVRAAHSTMHNRDHGELEMSALCHFTFSNQVFGSVNIDYLRPSRAAGHGDDRIRAAGTEGVIEVRGGKIYLMNNDTDGMIELPLEDGQPIFADFVKQVKGQGECLISAGDSFMITEASLKARQSADENRIIVF